MFRKIEFWSLAVAVVALGLGLYYHPLSHSSTKPEGPAATEHEAVSVHRRDGLDTSIPMTFAGNAPTGNFQVLTSQTLKTKAFVKVEQRTWNLETNSSGMFGRVTIPAKAVIPVHLELSPHEFVQIQVLDGGRLATHRQSQAEFADGTGAVDFSYEATDRNGSSRVAIFRHGVRQMFDFWIGPDLSSRVAANQ